jgi:hypothetical protein
LLKALEINRCSSATRSDVAARHRLAPDAVSRTGRLRASPPVAIGSTSPARARRSSLTLIVPDVTASACASCFGDWM